MKYRILLLSTILASGGAFAQMASTNLKKADIGALDLHAERKVTDKVIINEKKSDFSSRLYNDGLGVLIEGQDFSGGIAPWTNTSLAGGNEVWEYRGTTTNPSVTTGSRGQWSAGTGPIASTTASNGFVIFDSDYMDGGTSGTGGTQSAANHQAALTSPVIDCSTYPEVLLTFESHLRNFQSFFYVVVSNDGFTTSDTVWNGEDYYAVNEISPDAELVKIDVTDVLGGESGAQVRFLYSSNTEATNPGLYYWQIDDIALSTPPDHDLALDDVFFNGYGPFLSDYMFNNYPQQIPVRQSSADEVVLGAYLINRGSTAQTNASLETTVSGPASFSSSSTSFNFPAISTDSANVADVYSADQEGSYEVTFEISADSTDDFPDDNEEIVEFTVTERDYARNNEVQAGGVFWGTGSYAIYSRFDIFTADTVNGVWFNLYYSTTNTDFQTATGSVVEVGLYEVTGYDANGLPTVDLSTPIMDANGNEAVAYYTFEEADRNVTTLARFDAPVAVPGGIEVLAGYKFALGTIRTSTADDFAGYANIWIDTDNDGTLEGYTTTTNPIIGIQTWTASLCNNTTIAAIGEVNCDIDEYTAGVELLNVSGGASPYTFEWTGPGAFTSQDQDIEGLTTYGTYSVVVTDQNGCTTTSEFLVDSGSGCNLGVNDLSASKLFIYPNPAESTINVELENGGYYDLVITSIVGSIVKSSTMIGNAGRNNTIDVSDLAAGTYFIKMTDESNTAHVSELIIK